jgi:D-beta-D-heptose 7-phosphate kinase/D-beta-D-heptose 1-phosphate adenosyltransferase
MVDPKSKDYSTYRGVTVITPNTKEASEASGISITDELSLEKVGNKLLKKLSVMLWSSREEEGMTIFEPNQALFGWHRAKEVYDVTGAGIRSLEP